MIMKRLFIGFFAAVVALAGSAFTNVSMNTKKTGTFYYVLKPNGYYVKQATPPITSLCNQLGDNDCWIEYDEDQGTNFPQTLLPSATIISRSPFNGVYDSE